MTVAGFTFNILNPDPGTQVDFGAGSKAGSYLSLALRNKSGKAVQFIAEAGSQVNKSELHWTGRLLDEGKNVAVLAESKISGARTADFLVNGINTEIKELSNMTVGQNFVRNLVNKFKDAAGQASSVIIDGTKQTGFTKEAAEQALEGLKGKLKNETTYRVVGEGFDFERTVKPSN
ncbi:hypothetical protein ACFOTA_17850 [Chitinophaga sp. GCM10012297]|nr:hypothetical protein [Chitinophaga chungangae]